MRRRLSYVSLILLVVLEVVVLWRLTPPPPNPADAEPASFSAVRAQRVLKRLLGTGEPHPTGTAANYSVRARLMEELTQLGLSPELSEGPACGGFGVCANVENVTAIVPGEIASPALALFAHYDSVPASPGAADDGHGVASLIEIARALRATELPRSIALVFTDGEELGLLGARSFLQRSPLRKEIRAVLNLEARGSSGPSLMFQATPGAGLLIERLGRSAKRPITSSLFASVYERLPNDTDLTPLSQSGIRGLNFAFLDEVSHYHTPLDNLHQLALESVQHQGETALALARDLSNEDLTLSRATGAFFDVLGLFVFELGQSALIGLAALATLLLGLTLFLECRQGKLAMAELARGILAHGSSLLVLLGMAHAVGVVLERAGALPSPFIASPTPLLLAILVMALAAWCFVLGFVKGERQSLGLNRSTILLWLGFGWVLLVVLSPASYLVLVYACAASTVALIQAWFSDRDLRAWSLVPAAIAALLWLPPLSLLYQVIGFVSLPLYAAVFALFLGPWALLLRDLLERRRFKVFILGSSALLVILQASLPAYSADAPQRLSLALSVDELGRERWLADTSFGKLPKALAAVVPWSSVPADPHPWPSSWRTEVLAAPAKVGPLPAPHAEFEPFGLSRLRCNLSLSADAWAISVHIPGDARLVRASWRGQRVLPRRESDFQTITVVPGVTRRVQLELEFAEAVPRGIEVSQLTLGLPAAGKPLIDARAGRAVMSQFGDMTIVQVVAP